MHYKHVFQPFWKPSVSSSSIKCSFALYTPEFELLSCTQLASPTLPFFPVCFLSPPLCDQPHPATRVELLMPGEVERWFHCVFSCGDGWLSEAARGVPGRRASVENKYTCLLLMHRATLTAMQINHSICFHPFLPGSPPATHLLALAGFQMRLSAQRRKSSQLPSMVWFSRVVVVDSTGVLATATNISQITQ